MFKQYTVLTEGLRVIKNCNLPQIEKLKLEVLLIQMKQLLLKEDVESRIKGNSQSEAEFARLAAQIRDVCSPVGDVAAAVKLTIQISSMMERLKEYLVTGAAEGFSMRRILFPDFRRGSASARQLAEP